MRINEAFVDELLELAAQECAECDVPVNDSNMLVFIKRWIDDMEDNLPRNRAEARFLNHLEFAIDRLVARLSKTLQTT